MVDVEAVLMAFIQTKPVWAELGQRIHVGELPDGYTPSMGAAVVITRRPFAQDEARMVMSGLIQFTTYGFTDEAVRQAEAKLYRDLNDTYSPDILRLQLFQSAGSVAKDSSTGWRFAVLLFNGDFMFNT